MNCKIRCNVVGKKIHVCEVEGGGVCVLEFLSLAMPHSPRLPGDVWVTVWGVSVVMCCAGVVPVALGPGPACTPGPDCTPIWS